MLKCRFKYHGKGDLCSSIEEPRGGLRMKYKLFLTFVVGIFLISPASAEVNPSDIDYNFGSGNIGNLQDGGINTIDFSLNSDGLWYYWFMFDITRNAKDQTVTFNIDNANMASIGALSSYDNIQPVYSYDGENWYRISASNYVYNNPNYQFWQTFTEDSVLVAITFPQTYDNLQKYLSSIGNLNYVTRENMGYSTEGRNLDLITITNFSIPIKDKKVIWIISGQHPGEHTGMWVVRGMIEFLASTNQIAEE